MIGKFTYIINQEEYIITLKDDLGNSIVGNHNVVISRDGSIYYSGVACCEDIRLRIKDVGRYQLSINDSNLNCTWFFDNLPVNIYKSSDLDDDLFFNYNYLSLNDIDFNANVAEKSILVMGLDYLCNYAETINTDYHSISHFFDTIKSNYNQILVVNNLDSVEGKGGLIQYCSRRFIPISDGSSNTILYNINKLAETIYDYGIKCIDVEISLNNNKLSASISINSTYPSWYRVDLKRDGVSIDSINQPIDNNIQWTLDQSGIYSIVVHASSIGYKKLAISESKCYLNSHDERLYNIYLSKREYNYYKLPLRHTSDPYNDFVIISSNVLPEGIQQNQLKKHNISDKFPNVAIYLENDCDFSSLMIFGIPYNDVNIMDVGDICGSYTYVYSDLKGIHIGKDPFNLCQVYYYNSDTIFMASNCYHLLIETLVELGVKLSLDYDKVFANLSIFGTQYYVQNYSSNMDVYGIKMLQIHHNILFDGVSLLYINNKFGDILESDVYLSPDEYFDLLKKGMDEICNNICYTRDAYPVVCDLTGGIDSRIVYGVLNRTNVHPFINSYDNEETDIAIAVNRIYNYQVNQLPWPVRVMSNEEADLWMRSNFMGRSYEFNLDIKYKNIIKNTALVGAFGEVLTRPEYGSHGFEHVKNPDEINDVFYNYYLTICHNIKADSSASNCLLSQSEHELQSIPGYDAFEKLETIYAMYRHSLHFDAVMFNERNVRVITPMQSLSLLKIHHCIYGFNNSMQLAFDLLKEENPILLSIPFIHEKYNDYYRTKIMDNYNIPYVDGVSVDEHNAWKKEYNRRPRIPSSINDDPIELFYNKGIKRVLLELLSDTVIESFLGKSLFYLMIKCHDYRKNVFYNKLCSILDQLMIIRGRD